MKPNIKFVNQTHQFWALVRLASESLGYSNRKSKGQSLRRFTVGDILNLEIEASFDKDLEEKVTNYLNYRASVLEDHVKPLLMDRKKAKEVFESLIKNYEPKCNLPFNKQKK